MSCDSYSDHKLHFVSFLKAFGEHFIVSFESRPLIESRSNYVHAQFQPSIVGALKA